MDEYISRNELLKDVNSNVAEADNERCAQILEAILNAPIADVVPKSEVEQLQRKYDLAVAEREANVKGFAEELEKANAEIERLKKYNTDVAFKHYNDGKAEVAGEIFAEVDNFILIPICGKKYTELKKKYTEETK